MQNKNKMLTLKVATTNVLEYLGLSDQLLPVTNLESYDV